MRAAKARGLRIGAWYAEKWSSRGRRGPELERLRKDVRGGRVNHLLVYKLDRLSRNGIPDMFDLLNEFRAAGCKVQTIGDGFDLGGPADDIIIAVLAWAAQMERARIGDRIAEARLRVEASGGSWGRPARVTAELATKIRSLKKAGRTVRAIAIAVKIHRATVQRVLSQKGAYKSTPGKSTKKGTRSGRRVPTR